MGARDEHVGIVDLPVRVRAASDHQLTLVQPGLPHRLGAWALLQRQQQTHAATSAMSGRHPTIVRSRMIVSISPFGGPRKPGGPGELDGSDTRRRHSFARQHDAQIDVERFPDHVANGLLEQFQTLAARQERLEVLKSERADAQFDPALTAENARADRRPAAERRVGLGQAGSGMPPVW